jgi:hypothetical protein
MRAAKRRDHPPNWLPSLGVGNLFGLDMKNLAVVAHTVDGPLSLSRAGSRRSQSASADPLRRQSRL